MAQPRAKFDGIAEDPNPVGHRIWGSVRLTYTICAFVAMILHLSMRNALSFAILCMVKANPLPTERSLSSSNAGVQQCRSDAQNQTSVNEEGEFEWTRPQEFLLLGSFYYGYLITQPFAGRLCDRYGGKLFFILSLTVQAVVFMLTPVFARLSFTAILVMRIVQGLVGGFGSPSIYQLYSVWAHPTERTALMSFTYGGYSVGSLLIFPLASFLCRYGWPVVFYVLGGVSLVYGISCQWLIYSTLEAHPRLGQDELNYLKPTRVVPVPTIPWKSILTSVPVYAFLVTHICHSFGVIVFTLLLPKFLREGIGFSMSETGVFAAAPFAGSCLSKLITVTFCTHIQATKVKNLTIFRRIVYCSCNVLTVFFIIGIIVSNCHLKILIVSLILFIGISTDISFSGAYWVSLLDFAPAFSGLLSGIANSFATLIGSLAPILTSKIVIYGTKTEWNLVFLSMICSYGFATVIYGLFSSSKLQPWGKHVEKRDSAKNTRKSVSATNNN